MKNIITVSLAFVALIVFTFNLFSRPERVQQVPNGSKNQCMTCHTSSSGGARNSFGQTVGQQFLSGGKVVWGAALAALDSDGDGFTNGEELLDPTGAWTSGSQNPGNANDVGNPGDPTSRPNVSSVFGNEANQISGDIQIISSFPNPFYDANNISYQLNSSGNFAISIYSEAGVLVNSYDYGFQNSGNYEFVWDGSTFVNNNSAKGVYFIYLQLNDSAVMQKVVMQ